MVEDSSLGRVRVHIRGIPCIGHGGVTRPDPVIVALSDISFRSEYAAVASRSVDQDCIWSVPECRSFDNSFSIDSAEETTELTIFLLQGPKPDMTVFWSVS